MRTPSHLSIRLLGNRAASAPRSSPESRTTRRPGLQLAVGVLLAAISGAAPAAIKWEASASHLDQTSSISIKATVVGTALFPDEPSTFSSNDAVGGIRESKGTVTAKSTTGSATASIEQYKIILTNPRDANPATDSGSFLDTLESFKSKTGQMGGSYTVIFKQWNGFDETPAIGGGLEYKFIIDYGATFDTVAGGVDFAKSDCPYVGKECRLGGNLNLKGIPQSIKVSMGLSSNSGANQAPHVFSALMSLQFGEILPCPPETSFGGALCVTPVDYKGGPGGSSISWTPYPVPEPSTWIMLVAGFGILGCWRRLNLTNL